MRRVNAVPRSVSLATATALVVANIIGTGVFTSLGFQVKDIPSPFALLALWVVGGVAALCGALSYGELGAALPRSGGEYHFLSAVYHPAAGFVAGWVSGTVGFAAPVAITAIAFESYLRGVFPGIPALPIAFAIVWTLALVHLWDAAGGGLFQTFSTALKVILIAGAIGAGFLAAHPQPVSFRPGSPDAGLVFSAPFAISLVFVMYSYSGWNASTYIGGEMREPGRNIPLSLLLGTVGVAILYIALNAVFLRTTPEAELSGQLEVGLIAGKHIFGAQGGRVMGALICIGLVSSISSMTWIGPRVSMAMGEDVALLRFLAFKTARGVPAVAVLFQAAIASVLLATASFEKISTFIQFSLTLCSFLTVLGVIVLRFTRPELPRPYRTWGYPATPLIFLGITAFMMVEIVRWQPKESFAGLGTMLLGLVVYFASPKRGERV